MKVIELRENRYCNHCSMLEIDWNMKMKCLKVQLTATHFAVCEFCANKLNLAIQDKIKEGK